MVLEALVSAFLAAAVLDSQVVEIVAADIARAAAEVVADIAGDDIEVVAEVVDNCIEAVAAEIAVASVQKLVVCKTHPGSATVATAVD